MKNRPFFNPVLDQANRRTCMLIVTHNCNLDCSYCYESHKDKANMSVELAKKLILREFDFVKRSSRFKEMEIDFMGGEPLMNFDLIRQIVEWLETGVSDVPYICFATTNGTLLNDERKSWLRKHKRTICLTASYDGTSTMQQENRHTGENTIDLEFFHELWPEQGFHMTVSRKTLPNLFNGLKILMKKGWRVEVALAQGEQWTREDSQVLKRELRKFKDAYLNGEFSGVIDLLRRDLYTIGDVHKRETMRRYCGAGENMVTYEIDGTAYGCHLFTPLVLGEENALTLKERDMTGAMIELDEKCKNCVLADYCSTCMGFNYRYRGDLGRKDMNFCLMNLAIAEVSCEFQAATLAKESTYSKTEAEFAKSVLNAYPILAQFDSAVSEAPFIAKNLPVGKERR